MKKNEIIKNYTNKVKNFKSHNNLYHNYDKPEISDALYDQLKQDIFKLEKKFKYLKDLGLTKNIVGSIPVNKFKKIQHLRPMLSLSNAFNQNDMKDFLKKIKNFLNNKNANIELFAEPKVYQEATALLVKIF